MNEEMFVKVQYQNSRGEIIKDREYSLSEYAEMLRMDLMRLISSVEDLIYMATLNQPKEDWPDNVWNGFLGVKHKLLDKANDIGRLPQTLIKKSEDSLG